MAPLIRRSFLTVLPLALVGAWFARGWRRDMQRAQDLSRQPLQPPGRALRVYHLGHSLVGRDMPAMLAQLAGAGHRYDSQLGWGTPLRAHWETGVPITGFDEENDHPRYRPARGAVASGDYDALVLTEMVEIRDAIAYHDSPRYLATWAGAAWAANPSARIYLYETWHRTDDPAGWLARIDADLPEHWLGEIVLPVLGDLAADRPIHIIPAGQVMARFIRRLEDAGGIDGLRDRHDLFARTGEGTPDTIHLNDLGAYLVALTHFAVLYHRTPVGAARQLRRADGTAAAAPGPVAAQWMQEAVWEVVTGMPQTGVAG